MCYATSALGKSTAHKNTHKLNCFCSVSPEANIGRLPSLLCIVPVIVGVHGEGTEEAHKTSNFELNAATQNSRAKNLTHERDNLHTQHTHCCARTCHMPCASPTPHTHFPTTRTHWYAQKTALPTWTNKRQEEEETVLNFRGNGKLRPKFSDVAGKLLFKLAHHTKGAASPHLLFHHPRL